MGVLGLTPFLQKTCPEVIKVIPDRLKALIGKTVVIDGTLITQRLHWAQMPYRYRHVLGWYRIVRELQECRVGAICVFDGKERSLAKKQEVERRREVRRVDAIRGSMEVERLRRLRKLSTLLPSYQTLQGSEREAVAASLRVLFLEKAGGAPSALPMTQSIFRPRVPFGDADTLDDPHFGALDAQDILEVLREHDATPSPLHSWEAHDVTEYISSRFRGEDEYSINWAETGPNFKEEDSSINGSEMQVDEHLPLDVYEEQYSPDTLASINLQSPDRLFASLASLYEEYRRSMPLFASLPPTSADGQDIPPGVDAFSDQVMSKSQLQLAFEEGRFWEALLDPNTSTVQHLKEPIALAERSHMLSQSYERRSNPPTFQTYDESKALLRAMGIPCIDSTGPFEAEALASSLVLHGYGDFVASEDTDVLVYEVPLIRNLSNRQGPLLLMSGPDIRSHLELDQASYLDFALLLGTDFSQRIKNVGPQRALKFIKAHGSIERVIEYELQYPPRVSTQAYLKQVEVARLVFQTLPPVPDAALLKPLESDETAVAAMIERYGLRRAVQHDWDYGAALDGNYFQDDPSVGTL